MYPLLLFRRLYEKVVPTFLYNFFAPLEHRFGTGLAEAVVVDKGERCFFSCVMPQCQYFHPDTHEQFKEQEHVFFDGGTASGE